MGFIYVLGLYFLALHTPIGLRLNKTRRHGQNLQFSQLYSLTFNYNQLPGPVKNVKVGR